MISPYKPIMRLLPRECSRCHPRRRFVGSYWYFPSHGPSFDSCRPNTHSIAIFGAQPNQSMRAPHTTKLIPSYSTNLYSNTTTNRTTRLQRTNTTTTDWSTHMGLTVPKTQTTTRWTGTAPSHMRVNSGMSISWDYGPTMTRRFPRDGNRACQSTANEFGKQSTLRHTLNNHVPPTRVPLRAGRSSRQEYPHFTPVR